MLERFKRLNISHAQERFKQQKISKGLKDQERFKQQKISKGLKDSEEEIYHK